MTLQFIKYKYYEYHGIIHWHYKWITTVSGVTKLNPIIPQHTKPVCTPNTEGMKCIPEGCYQYVVVKSTEKYFIQPLKTYSLILPYL